MYRITVKSLVIEGVKMWVGTLWWDSPFSYKLRLNEVWAKTPPLVLRRLASTMATHTLTTPARKNKGKRV